MNWQKNWNKVGIKTKNRGARGGGWGVSKAKMESWLPEIVEGTGDLAENPVLGEIQQELGHFQCTFLVS